MQSSESLLFVAGPHLAKKALESLEVNERRRVRYVGADRKAEKRERKAFEERAAAIIHVINTGTVSIELAGRHVA